MGQQRLCTTLVAASALALGACEAIPLVHLSVVEAATSAEAPIFVETFDIDTPTRRSAAPLPNVLIVVRPADGDATSYERHAVPIAAPAGTDGHGNGADWPVLMRTDANGYAKYSELRLSPLFFVPFRALRRNIELHAAGFEPVVVTVEFDVGTYTLVVPMRRHR